MEDPVSRRALEHDLLRAGYRLRWFLQGRAEHTWGDLVAFVQFLTPDAALSRVRAVEHPGWGLDQDLMALVADRLTVIQYMLSGEQLPREVLVGRHHTHNQPTTPPTPAVTSTVTIATAGVEPAGPVGWDPETDLNDRNTSGIAAGTPTTTGELARMLGWTLVDVPPTHN